MNIYQHVYPKWTFPPEIIAHVIIENRRRWENIIRCPRDYGVSRHNVVRLMPPPKPLNAIVLQ